MLKPKEYPFNSTIGWSHSKMYPINNCERQFYYDRIKDKWLSGDKATIIRLRNLTSLPIIIGTTIHKSISDYFEDTISGNSISKSAFFEKTKAIFLDEVKKKELAEEYYNKDNLENIIIKSTEKMNNLSELFWNLPDRIVITENIISMPHETWLEKPGFFGEFRIDDFKGYAPPDMIVKDKDGKYLVLSWKTGTHNIDGFLMQLAGNVMCTIHTFGLDENIVYGKVINLNNLEGQPVEIDGFSPLLSRCLERMKEERIIIEKMYDSPIYQVPKKFEDYTCAQSQDCCTRCKYRKICGGP